MPMVLDDQTVHLISVTQTYFAAIYAVAVWDWLISLRKEYDRIWKAPWSLVKVLYICNRYYTLLNLIFTLYGFNGSFTAAECNRLYKWEPGLASFTTIFAEAILVIRTYALWGKNRYILYILSVGFIAECAILFFAVTQFQPVPTRDPTDPESRGVCIAGGGPGGHDWSMAYWVSPIVMDTLMLVLTSIRALQYRSRGVTSNILQTFIKDGVLYFAVVFVVNLINTIFYSLPVQALQAVNSPMSLLMTSIMCSRIVLSLRAEEKIAMESVSKDWQVNTFLRKKQQTSGSRTHDTSVHRGVVNTLPPTHDIHLSNLEPTLPHPYGAHQPSKEIDSAGFSRDSSGGTNGRGNGIRVDIETGVHVEERDKSSDRASWSSQEKRSDKI